MRCTPEEISTVLDEFKQAIKARKIILVDRKKNNDSLAKLGLMPYDIWPEIIKLSAADYKSGPDPDRDRPDKEPFWIFKKLMFGEIFYIKFKIIRDVNNNLVKIVGCHIDDFE